MSPSPQGCCIHFSHEIASWESERKQEKEYTTRERKRKLKRKKKNREKRTKNLAILPVRQYFLRYCFPRIRSSFSSLSSRCFLIYFSILWTSFFSFLRVYFHLYTQYLRCCCAMLFLADTVYSFSSFVDKILLGRFFLSKFARGYHSLAAIRSVSPTVFR